LAEALDFPRHGPGRESRIDGIREINFSELIARPRTSPVSDPARQNNYRVLVTARYRKSGDRRVKPPKPKQLHRSDLRKASQTELPWARS